KTNASRTLRRLMRSERTPARPVGRAGAAGRSTANPKHADSAARSKIFNPSANKLRRKWCIGSVPNAAAVQRCRPARPLSSEPPVERLGNEGLALVEDGASHA